MKDVVIGVLYKHLKPDKEDPERHDEREPSDVDGRREPGAGPEDDNESKEDGTEFVDLRRVRHGYDRHDGGEGYEEFDPRVQPVNDAGLVSMLLDEVKVVDHALLVYASRNDFFAPS